MESTTRTISDLIVIDPKPEDYQEILHGVAGWNLHVSYFERGEEALRDATALLGRLFLINIQLPDMHGLDLLRLIRQRNPKASVLIVANAYEFMDEVKVRSAGPAGYVCKPPHRLWLSNLQPRVRDEPADNVSILQEYSQPLAHY